MDLPEPPLTVREVANFLRKKEASVRNLLRTGRLKGVKLEGQWRIKRDDLMAYTMQDMVKNH